MKKQRLAPSRLKALEICPKWANDDTAPEHPTTTEGKLLHKVMETGKGIDALTPGQIDLIEWTRQVLQSLSLTAGEDRQTLVEFEMNILGMRAFADRVILDRKNCEASIVDFKFAYNLQEDAEENPQTQAYALGIFDEFPWANSVSTYLLYPRLGKVSTHRFERADRDRIALRIRTIRAMVEDENSRAKPYEPNCMYCGNKADCPALHDMVLPLAKKYGQKHEMEISAVWEPSGIWKPEGMAAALDASKILKKWCESVSAHALKMRVDGGQEIPGYELRVNAGELTILHPDKVYEAAIASGLTHTEFMQAVDISIKKLGDMLANKAPQGEKGKVKNAFVQKLLMQSTVVRGKDTHQLRKQNNKED